MPRTHYGASVEKLEDLTGALKMQRWNYCQAIARALYKSGRPLENIKYILKYHNKICSQAEKSTD